VAGGPYAIVASNAQGTGLGNYTITYVNGSLAVTPAPLTVTAGNQSKGYGTALNLGTGAFTTGTLFNGDSVNSVALTSTGAAATANVAGGPYAIVASNAQGTGLGNYTITYVNGSLAVTPAPLTITANNQSKVYGTTLNLGTGAFTMSGTLYNDDSVNAVTLTSAGAAGTANVAGSPYAIVASNAQVTGLSNYAITYVNGALSVTPAPLTVTANAQTSVYGNAIPSLTYVSSGLRNEDTLSGSLATPATPTSSVGQYAITQGTLAGSPNYNISFVSANLTINPRALTVTAAPESRVYGDPNPPLAFVVGGSLLNGDSLGGNLATPANTTSNVGQYTINQGTLSNPNYAISFAPGILTINPRPLKVLANPTTVVLGTSNPPLTFGVGGPGLVNGDALNGSLATTLQPGTVGQFPITEGTLGNPNYAISFVPAAVTVIPPPISPFQQITQNLVANGVINLVALTPGDVVNTQPLTQSLASPPRTGPGPGPNPGPGGLPPQFGARFFTPPPLGETRFVKDELVLHIPTNIPMEQLQPILAQLGLSILGSQNLGLIGVTSYQVHIGNGTSIASVLEKLAHYQIFAGAQANYTYNLVQDHAPELAQDPDLAGRTDGEGDAAQYAIGKLGLIDIHRQVKGSNVTVAVIDSQIDIKHPDLDGVVAEQFDAVGAADQPHSHGTGMAGAIFSHRRLMGVAPAARLYAVHAFSSGAASPESTTFNILKGLEWASDKGVRVINMSFAGPRDPSMERALKAAHDRGIVLIAAAGNAGPKSPPLYPGADPNVIAVTATDVNDKLFSGANRGRYIAVAAPGVDVLVAAPDNSYQLTTGTSVASAEVSGLAALLIERNPSLGPEDVRKVLTTSARRLGAKDRDDDFGSGLVDPTKAIQTAGDFKPTDITGAAPPRPAVQSQPPTTTIPPRPPVLSASHPGGTPLRISH
jgi:subtilisin family serine protease